MNPICIYFYTAYSGRPESPHLTGQLLPAPAHGFVQPTRGFDNGKARAVLCELAVLTILLSLWTLLTMPKVSPGGSKDCGSVT